MKKIKGLKKLQLNKKTVARLDDKEMSKVRGGFYSDDVSCQHECFSNGYAWVSVCHTDYCP